MLPFRGLPQRADAGLVALCAIRVSRAKEGVERFQVLAGDSSLASRGSRGAYSQHDSDELDIRDACGCRFFDGHGGAHAAIALQFWRKHHHAEAPVGSKMFVLLTGSVKVVGGETYGQKGTVIGEHALFEGNTKRTGTVQAVKECEFLCLKHHRDFLELLDLYPSNRAICERYVASYSPFPEIYGSVRLCGDIGDDFVGSSMQI